MKLLENFYDAREALEMAHRIMSSEEKTEREKLDAMLTAFAAERSIEIDQQNGIDVPDPDPDFWQRRYDQVKAFRDAYNEASRRANEASRRAFLDSMKASFEELPVELKESMNASFHPAYGWNFLTEY
jgi:uncharacterized membrane protein YccC